MGNQQATLSTEDLGWLGGILDGEGCISLTRRPRAHGVMNYKPYVVISNSDPFLIEEIASLLRALGIGHWVQWRRPHRGTMAKKMMGIITVAGLRRCEKALALLTPYIRGKKREAELVAEWITRRLAINPGKNGTYSEKDDWYYTEIRRLKDKGAPETIRGGHRWASEPDDGKI